MTLFLSKNRIRGIVEFKNFLLNERAEYFGSKIGDLLNAIQDLVEISPNIGSRHLNRQAEAICNQIRAILRNKWSVQQRPFLEKLQQVGVAIMKTIEERGDLKSVLVSAQHELQQVSSKIGSPINQMGSGLAES